MGDWSRGYYIGGLIGFVLGFSWAFTVMNIAKAF